MRKKPIFMILLLGLIMFALVSGCGDDEDKTGSNTDDTVETNDEDTMQSPKMAIVPGVSVGSLKVGMKSEEVNAILNEEPEVMAFNHMVSAVYKNHNIEIMYTSPGRFHLEDGAIVAAVGVMSAEGFTGDILPGMTVEEAKKAAGEEGEDTGSHIFFQKGLSIEIENGKVKLVGVFAPYTIEYEPPVMQKAKGK